MSGRSAKEALEKLKGKAEKAYNKARDIVRGGDPDDVPTGDGMVDRAKEAIKGRRDRLDKAIDGDEGR